MKLIIVESPTKAKTISGFLKGEYKIMSSNGHIRDLPKSKFGLDLENDFKPSYVIPLKARKTVTRLKKEVENSELVILATDEDREGEAISWHLAHVLGLDGQKPYQRIVFHEITKRAIEEALQSPRKIDTRLVEAQQARRILDRIVGYKLSPFLWEKVLKGLSAGRVQSVAVRLIVEREREIQNFIPQEYWTIEADFTSLKEEKPFKGILTKKDSKIIPKLGIKNKEEAEKIIAELKGAEYRVLNVKEKEVKKNPPPPFTTSTLQQEAWKKLHFPAKFTMQIAQQLYEKGLITYHRTDSLNLSTLATSSAAKFIRENYGKEYHQFRKYQTKNKTAQEAHEAVRPTYIEKTPGTLFKDDKLPERKLYELIWRRFLASQMASAVLKSTKAEIAAKNYIFQATGAALKFEGFLKVYPIELKENLLPPLKESEVLKLIKISPLQHFTQPPARYNEATLIKTLEQYGIGRPSTYAPIISTIQERNYVIKDDQKKFRPTEVGFLVTEILVKHFPEIVDVKFTAQMEESLDKIARGQKNWVITLKEFYLPFANNLQTKYQEVSKKQLIETAAEKKCPKCSNNLVVKFSRFGKFYACSNFPNCKYKESILNKTNIQCPKCKEGQIIVKKTKKGKTFYGCERFPKCDFALWEKPTGEYCPQCQSLLVEIKNGKRCSNKECNYKKQNEK